jgi:hypothetical protein
MAETPVQKPADPSPLAEVVVKALWVYAALMVLSILGSGVEVSALRTVDPGQRLTLTDPIPNAGPLVEAAGLVGGLQFLGFIVAAILVLRWIYRVNKNARLLAPDKPMSPGWAVGWFFVPIMNLWKPFQGMNQSWRIATNPSAWKTVPTPPVLRWWWGLWLLGNFLGNISFRIASGGKTAGAIMGSDVVDIFGGGALFGTTLVLIRIVRELTARQAATLAKQAF